MSNSEPSAIVLQGVPCIGGLYRSFDSNGENGSLKVRLWRSRKVRHVCFPKLTQAICKQSLKMQICHGDFRKGASGGMGTRGADFDYGSGIPPRRIVTTCSTVRLAVSIMIWSRFHGR